MQQKFGLKFSKQIQRKLFMVLGILIMLAILGIGTRVVKYVKLKHSTRQYAILNVATIKIKQGSMKEEIILPGNVQAWHEATIFARTNGYIIRWIVDIGAHVKAGDLLAQISAPEVVAQLHSTQANLKTAQANYQLAQSTAKRWVTLLKTDSVSKQETDEKVSDAAAKAAIVVSTQAEVQRLSDLVSYQQVIAPFDGVIMSRTTDIGRLINAGSGSVPLFRLVQSQRLRIYVRVPEYFAKNITPTIDAELIFAEHPGKKYKAKLLDTAKAIDATTRTLLVQLEVDNPNYELLAGSYTQIHFIAHTKNSTVRLPVNALIFRTQGLQVATINNKSEAIFKSIIVGRDFGNTIEVVSGLSPGDEIILNPPDALFSGQQVHMVSSDVMTQDEKNI